MALRFYISSENAPFFNNNTMGYGNAIPTSGTYKVGDFIISSTQQNGIFGWVCTVAGTPGTWEVIGSGNTGGDGTVILGGGNIVGYFNAVEFTDARSSIEIGIPQYINGEDFLEVHYNGLLLVEGVHYNISEDGLKIEVIGDPWNKDADDTQQMIFRVIKSEGIVLKELNNTININVATTEVEIGIDGYVQGSDIIEVHLNGVLLVEDVDYNVVDGKLVKIDKSEPWNMYNVQGQKMFIKVFKNTGLEIKPGKGTVTLDTLDPEVLEKMEASMTITDVVVNNTNNITDLDERLTVIEEKIESGDIVTNGGGGGSVKLTYKDNLVEVVNTNTVAIGLPFNKEKDMLEVHINGLKLAEGVHYNISEDGLSIVKVEGVWNPDSLEDQYIDFRVITAGNEQIEHLTNNIEFSSPMTEVEIGLEYEHGIDILIVHLNGIKLVEGLDFEYVAEGNKIVKIDASEPWNLYGVDGQLFVIDVLRNIGEKVTMDGLADDVKQAIARAGSSKLKGKTIVRFGDSITEDGVIVDETISALTGANIINVGVACARMTSDDWSQGYDGFSMTNLVFAYYNQKQGNENPWSYQEEQNEITKGNGDDNTEILNRLKNIDFSQVDYVLISYGTNDFAGNVPLGGLHDSWWDETGKTFCGAVNFSVSMLLTMYPHLKIVFTSPTWRGRLYEDEITCDSAINSENLMLKHYVKSLKLLCEKNHVQFIDLFNIGINEFNHDQYLWDRLHFNETGAALLGEYIANGLLNSSPMNEAEMLTGDLSYLHTDDKTDLVAAINEVNVYAHDNIGAVENLQTTNKGNLVEAINEVEIETVTIKNSLVDVLNNKGISCSTDQSWFELFTLLVNNTNTGGEDTGGEDVLLSGQWNTLRSIGTARSAIGVCAYNGKIYCLGGLKTGAAASNLFNCYDPSTDTWETLTPYPSNIFGAACLGINEGESGRIYVFAIMDTPNSDSCKYEVYCYDITEKNWTLRSSQSSNSLLIPSKAFYNEGDDRVYVLNRDPDTLAVKVYTNFSGFDYLYDDGNYTNFVSGSANCYHNGRIYSIGGYIGNAIELRNTVLALDTSSNTVMELSPFPMFITGASAEVYDNKIYVFGGRMSTDSTGTDIPNTNMYVYDISNDSWTEIADKGMEIVHAGTCIIDNKIYSIGGDTRSSIGTFGSVVTPSNNTSVFVIGE